MDGNGVVVEFLYRSDHFLMNLPSDKHQEREALFFIVVRNHKVIEVCLVLHVLVKRFDAPALFIPAEHFFWGFGAVALQDVHTECFLALLKLLPRISGTLESHAVLVVITTLFVFIDVTEAKSKFVCKLPSGITVDNYAARRTACSSAI